MSVGSPSKSVHVADGANTAKVDDERNLSVSGPEIQQLITLAELQLRELRKISLMLGAATGVVLEDDDLKLL